MAPTASTPACSPSRSEDPTRPFLTAESVDAARQEHFSPPFRSRWSGCGRIAPRAGVGCRFVDSGRRDALRGFLRAELGPDLDELHVEVDGLRRLHDEVDGLRR